MSLTNIHTLHEELLEKTKKLIFKDVKLPQTFKDAYAKYLHDETPNGYQTIVWADYSSKIITSTGKYIYVTNYWFYIASELAKFTKVLNEYKTIFNEAFKGKNSKDLKTISESLRDNIELIDSNAVFQSLSEQEQILFKDFVSNYDLWGGGKTIDRNDFYVSPVLKSGNLLAESQSAIAELASQLATNEDLWIHLRDKITLSNSSAEEIAFKKNVHHPVLKVNLPKPFILLAGISGTGKTRFVKEQASYFTEDKSNYQLVSVRPDWHEPSDLLGYISRLGDKGPQYIATDFLQFIVAAWKHIIDHIDHDTLHFNPEGLPYWLCLDEMNLAPVEQYFADYLSVIETRHWDGEGVYHCAPLLNAGIFARLAATGLADLRSHLGLLGLEHDALWAYFQKKGISIPPNLIVAGTVNMDETTHGFSRKVIDRAFTLDFGEFFPNDYQAYFNQKTRVKALTYPTISQVDLSLIAAYDPEGQQSIVFLEAINAVLKGTPFELAYRALNELLIAVICFMPKEAVALQAVWDDFLMTKVLPRIEGDSEKLQDDGENSLLTKLEGVLAEQLNEIWAKPNSRPDFLREGIKGEPLAIACRCQKKLAWMKARLSSNGFTAFWP